MRSSVAYALAPSAVLAGVLWLTSVPPLTSLLLVFLVAWQSLGGFLIWRAIRPQSTPLELLGMGIAIGTAIAAIMGLITSTAGWGPWGALLPTAAALTIVYLTRRNNQTSVAPRARWETPAFLTTMAVGLAVFVYALRSYPLTWTGSWTGYHPDMAFFEALANSLARFGAFESPFMSGSTIHYHWLSYAWTGQLSVMADTAPFVGITRVLPLVSLVGSAAIVVAWTRRMSAASWTPFLAGALLTVSGFVGAVFGGILTLDSPSQAMSVLWLLAFTLTLVDTFENPRSRWSLVLLAVLGIAITLGKVSAAAPALAAVLLASLVLAARKTISPGRALAITASTAIPIAVTFVAFLAGSSGGGGLTIGSLIDRSSSQQGLNPLDGTRGVLLGTAILILAVVPRWAGIVQLFIDKTWRWRAETWLSIGLAVTSIAAIVVFNSFNEIWFSVSASGPLAATSAVGAGLAVSSLQSRGRPRTRSIVGAAATGALIVFGAVWWAWSTGASGGNVFVSTQRWLGPLIAWVGALGIGLAVARWARGSTQPTAVIAGTVLALVFIAVPGRFLGIGSDQIGVLDNGIRNQWFNVKKEGRVVTIDQSEAIDWTDSKLGAAITLRNQAEPSDLVATNITRSPFVSGITHLPTFASGMAYQYDYGSQNERQELIDRERTVWNFINDPRETSAGFLCTEGITWLWVDKQRTQERSWEPFASPVFDNSEVAILRVDASLCE